MKDIKIFYIIKSLLGVQIFMAPIITIYYLNQVGISFHEFTMFESFVFMFIALLEIPTGVISDLLGRKKTFLLAQCLLILGMVGLLFSYNIYHVYLLGFLFALSAAFSSGSINALIFDKYKKNNMTKEYSALSRKGFSLMTLSGAIAAVIGGKLGEIDLRIPILLDLLALLLVTFACIFLITEKNSDKFRIGKKRSHLVKIVRESFYEFKTNKALLYFAILSAIAMGIFRVFFVSYQPILISVNANIEQIGYLFALMGLIASFSSYLSAKYDLNHINQFFLLIFFLIGLVCSLYIYTRMDFYHVILAIILQQILRGVFLPYSSYRMNTLIKSSEVRSTILSSYSLISTIVCSFFLILIGELKAKLSWENTYFIWGGISFTLLFAFIFLFLKSYNNPLENS